MISNINTCAELNPSSILFEHIHGLAPVIYDSRGLLENNLSSATCSLILTLLNLFVQFYVSYNGGINAYLTRVLFSVVDTCWDHVHLFVRGHIKLGIAVRFYVDIPLFLSEFLTAESLRCWTNML